ncbi:hypothetical protein A9R05_05450 [Burkholderia sp. KK1]|nr:hypothetical protein A9R05_05450 [Burkholderia sp. KK1]
MRLLVPKAGEKQHYISDLTEPAQALVKERFSSITDSVMNGVLELGFEVIKHLAVFNGGGLAGAAALAQVVEKDSAAHALTLQAAHLFVFGLIVALVTMLAIYLTGMLFLRRFIAETMDMLLGAQPIGPAKMSVRAKLLVAVSWALAALSIGLFLCGAFKIVAVA